MLRQQLLVDPRLVVVAVEVRGGRQRQEVAVADVVLGQEDHVVVVGVGLALLVGHAAGGDVGLDADDRLDPGLLGGGVERDDPVHGPVVGERQRWHPLLGDPLRHLPDAAQPVEQAELGVDVEVDEVAVFARVRGSQGHPQMLGARQLQCVCNLRGARAGISSDFFHQAVRPSRPGRRTVVGKRARGVESRAAGETVSRLEDHRCNRYASFSR